jgi:hypothetical protein
MHKYIKATLLILIILIMISLVGCSDSKKISELEKTVVDLQKQLSDKDSTIKNLQNTTTITTIAEATTSTTTVPAVTSTTKIVESTTSTTVPATTTTTKTAETTTTTQAQTSDYFEVFSFSGNSIKTSESFRITGSKFKIAYDCSGDLSQAFLYKENGDLVNLIVNSAGSAKDETIFRGAGTYYMDANMRDFSMVVYDYK